LAAYDWAVSSSLTVRAARVEDVAQMARVNVQSWQETYRGLMSNAVLDDPGFLAARERFWTVALTDERYRENRVAVAERDDPAGRVVRVSVGADQLAEPGDYQPLLILLAVAIANPTMAGGLLQMLGRRPDMSWSQLVDELRPSAAPDAPDGYRNAVARRLTEAQAIAWTRFCSTLDDVVSPDRPTAVFTPWAGVVAEFSFHPWQDSLVVQAQA
jgi:hypothetical protein